MPDKKLLIVSYSFPPSNVPAAQRPYYLYKYLKDDSIVLTSHTINKRYGVSQIDFENDKSVVRFGKRRVEGHVSSLSTNKTNLKYKILKSFLIPDKGITWFLSGIKGGKQILSIEKNITHIHSSSPSIINHIIAIYLGKIFNKQVICDFRDFYFLHALEHNQWSIKKYCGKFLENFIINKSDYLTFVSKTMHAEYKKKYEISDLRSKVIYNGYDKQDYILTNIETYLPNDKLKIFYAGYLYSGTRSPHLLLELLDYFIDKAIINIDSVSIDIAGVVEDNLLEKLKKYKSFKMINLIGILSKDVVIKSYKNYHLLLLIVGNKMNHYGTIPLKLFEYFGAQRPILSIIPEKSEINEILRNLEYNYTIHSENEALIEKNIKLLKTIFTDLSNGTLNKYYPPSKNLVTLFSRKNQAQQLINIVKNE